MFFYHHTFWKVTLTHVVKIWKDGFMPKISLSQTVNYVFKILLISTRWSQSPYYESANGRCSIVPWLLCTFTVCDIDWSHNITKFVDMLLFQGKEFEKKSLQFPWKCLKVPKILFRFQTCIRANNIFFCWRIQ